MFEYDIHLIVCLLSVELMKVGKCNIDEVYLDIVGLDIANSLQRADGKRSTWKSAGNNKYV